MPAGHNAASLCLRAGVVGSRLEPCSRESDEPGAARYLRGVTRPRARAVPLLGVALALAACVAARPAVEPWQSPFGKDHPLAGRIWDVVRGRFIDRDALAARLAAARFVLLGEQHENPDHHRLQAWVLRALIAAGRRPAVAFEMLTTADAPALARYLAAAPGDAAGLGAAVNWSRSGWPDWNYYRPIAAAALGAGLPLVAANIPPATARALTRGEPGALDPRLVARYGLDQPLPPAVEVAMAAEIHEAHCGQVAGRLVPGMIAAQRVRDAQMAESLVTGEMDGAVLIAGAGHVRTDRGVPAYLRARLPDAPVGSVAFLEVDRRDPSPLDYAERFGGVLPFDYVWFTPRVDDEDPCVKFRKSLERLKDPG